MLGYLYKLPVYEYYDAAYVFYLAHMHSFVLVGCESFSHCNDGDQYCSSYSNSYKINYVLINKVVSYTLVCP